MPSWQIEWLEDLNWIYNQTLILKEIKIKSAIIRDGTGF
ncbi:MAG: hypothetical protein Rsou_1305 [Candidatus Ruthia sp. Asou_11_S2]|nr:hypothetical protein [Candidatus Ruthia sp. Asou_11_S2]